MYDCTHLKTPANIHDKAWRYRLQQAMLEAGLNQSELADKLGESRITVNKWINGKSNPRAQKWGHIAKTLGVSEYFLFYGAPKTNRPKLLALMDQANHLTDEQIDNIIALIKSFSS